MDIFVFNVINTQTISGLFSTTEQITVDWGDGGGTSNYNGTDQAYSKDYGSAGNRTVTISATDGTCLTKFTMTQDEANVSFALSALPAGLTYFQCYGSNTVSGDIADLPVDLTYFRCYGSNTVSGDIADLPVDLTYFRCYGSNTVSGDIADLPAGLADFYCAGSNTVSGDLADLPAGLADFYCAGSNTVSGDLADLPAGLIYFLCGGSSTISGDIADLPVDLVHFACEGSNTISGDIADLPAGLTYFQCYGSNTVSGDIADLPSGLTAFFCHGSNTVSGDIADLPSGLTYFYCAGSNTISSYTGKTWTTKSATFTLTPASGGLSTAEIDQLLIDLDDDLAWAAGNAITLTGTNAPRSAASDVAVTSIEGEGATVITSNTLFLDTLYKITATEADHFGTGLEVGDYFTSDGTETVDASNKVKVVLTPTANGATIVSTQGDTTYNWALMDAGFDWNDLATYEISNALYELFEGDLYLTSFDETTASYEMKAIKYTTRLLTEGVDYDGNTVPYPKAFGTVTHVNPLRVADNDSKPTYHLGGLGTAADAKTIVNFDTSDAGAKTKVTVDVAHGWANDTSITIAGTVNFDGTHTISSVSGATFVINVAFPTDASETLPIHASAFVAGTFAVFDDGVPIQENVQVNGDGTFSLTASPVGEVTISGTADDTDLAEIMTWGQGQLGITSIDTTASRATAPDVNYWATSQMPLIDFLSELCAFFTHYFYIASDTLYLGDLLLDNGTSTLTEYEYFTASYSAYVPVNQIKATWTTREAYNGFVDEVRQARYVKDIKNTVVESVSTVSSGTTDSTDAGYLADSGAAFSTDGVKVGDIAQNTTDNTSTVVTAVTETKLTVRDDIFTDAEDYIVGPGFPYGQEISVEPFHDAKSNVQTALQNILTVLNKDTASVTIPMSDSLPVPGEKVTFHDTQTLSALSTYIRVRGLTYNFTDEEVTLTGEGVIS